MLQAALKAALARREMHFIVANGHDVFSQTLDHPCLSTNMQVASACDPMAPRSNDYTRQINQAATLLEQRAGVKPGTPSSAATTRSAPCPTR